MIKYIVCDKCGKKEDVVGIEKLAETSTLHKLMISQCLCSSCAQWEKFFNSNPENLEIIDGFVYHFNPMVYKKEPNTILGQRGKRFRILRRDGSVATSNDVWKVGEVPLAFREQHPDTAWFITPRAYGILKSRKGNWLCDHKGCYDRYHCLLYDIVAEKTKFNRIPKNYIVGSERCFRFININKDIRNYNVCETLIQSIFQV